MTHLTVSLEQEYRGIPEYLEKLPMSMVFDDLQKAYDFAKEKAIVHACFVTQWDAAGNNADIEFQCSMQEVEIQNEAGEVYHDLSFV